MKLMIILLSTLVVLFAAAFCAWGNPQPNTVGVSDGSDRRIYIAGIGFGSPPEFGGTDRMVESAAGLKSCVLLAEYQVLDLCKNLTVLPILAWNEESITTELRKPLPEDLEQMYLFIFDDEGGVSYAVGPLNIEEGIPASYNHWGLEEVENEDTGSVKSLGLLVPLGPPRIDKPIRVISEPEPEPEPEPESESEGPGQPGQPVRK